MLELVDVSKFYPAAAEPVCVLEQINLTVQPGQSVSFTGPSGSGKTTLLNLIGGLDRPSSGRVILNQTNLAALHESELAHLRNTRIGFVFQLHYLLPQCTVFENVLLPTLASKRTDAEKKQAAQRAGQLLEKVGLQKYRDIRPGHLSGGQRQRVAVARALIHQPQILLADEPTGSLDADTAEQIIQLLLQLNQTEKVTLITATHSEKLAQRMQRQFRVEHKRLAAI